MIEKNVVEASIWRSVSNYRSYPVTTSCKRKAAKILYIIEPVIGLLQRTEDS